MSKQDFWRGLANFGKNILAHVNLTFDGATGSIHIDIVPTKEQTSSPEQPKAIDDKHVAADQLPEPAQGDLIEERGVELENH